MPPASFVAGCPGAPTAGSSWTPVGGGPSSTNNVYTTWTSLPANLGSTRLLTSSPEGKSAFAFGNSSATPATLFSWNRAGQEWLELDTPGVGLSSVGLPAGAVKVYLVDIAVTGVIWLSLVDTVGATRFFSSQPSRDQLLSTASVSTVPAFVESPAATCGALPLMGAIAALPNGNALATSAAAPYALYTLDPDVGCVGSLPFSSLSGGAGLAPWSITVSASLYSVYSVLIAAAPTACAVGGSCFGSAVVYRHSTTYDNLYSTLLASSDWTPVSMPSGAGIAYTTVSVSSGRLYGVAPFCMTAAAVIGCACGTGYPLLASTNAGATWATAGCVPVLPTSLLVPSDSLVYVAGQGLGANSNTPVIAASANSGGRWVNTSGTVELPGGLAGCTLSASAGLGLQLASLAMHGGPIILTGLDNAHHGDPNDGPYACPSPNTAASTCSTVMCPGWQTLLTAVKLVNNASEIPSDIDVAVLGVDPTSSAVSAYSGLAANRNPLPGNSGAVFQTVCNLNLAATYWFGQSTTNRTIPAFFDGLAWGAVRPALIWIVESRGDWPITPADQAILAGYGPQLSSYCSRGGGLLSSTQYNGDMYSAASGGGTHYEFLLSMAPFMTIGLAQTVTTYSLQTPSLTTYGAQLFPELVSSATPNPNIEGPWHNCERGAVASSPSAAAARVE